MHYIKKCLLDIVITTMRKYKIMPGDRDRIFTAKLVPSDIVIGQQILNFSQTFMFSLSALSMLHPH